MPIKGDLERLGSLVDNLIDNAIKYGHGNVFVALSARGRHAHLEIRDNGPGIPLAQLERVFQRGTRLDPGSDPGPVAFLTFTAPRLAHEK